MCTDFPRQAGRLGLWFSRPGAEEPVVEKHVGGSPRDKAFSGGRNGPPHSQGCTCTRLPSHCAFPAPPLVVKIWGTS